MELSGIGIWSAGFLGGDPGEVGDRVAEVEELGYTSLWIPGFGNPFDKVERLLAASDRMVIGTGIVSIWAVTPDETAAAFAGMREAHGDRFLLGIGVSHASVVDAFVEGAHYERPMQTMLEFLDGLDAADPPVAPEARVLAALGPRMLGLARDRAGGAHPYNVTPDHTVLAREALGAGKLLVPEQAVALTTNAADARQMAREFLEHYLQLPNYANNLLRLGFTEDDLAHGGSDRLVDALIAWGDAHTIASRVQEHLDAGADSVCVQVVSPGGLAGMTSSPVQVWRDLAPALTALTGP